MIKRLVTLLLSSTIILLLSFTTVSDWFVLKKESFSIDFPKAPVLQTQTVPSDIGELQMEMHLYDGSVDNDMNFLYGVVTSLYPDSIVNSSKTEVLDKFFRGSIDGMVSNVKGKLLSEKKIEINGFPGREVEVDFQNGLAIVFVRSYLVHNKMYILQTITPTDKALNENVLRFHNSFKLNTK